MALENLLNAPYVGIYHRRREKKDIKYTITSTDVIISIQLSRLSQEKK